MKPHKRLIQIGEPPKVEVSKVTKLAKTKLVYAVNSGCYSDYRVDAMFSTKEKAQEFMETFLSDYNDIQTFDIDPNYANLVKRGYSVWQVLMLKDGNVEDARLLDMDKYNATNAPKHWIWERTKAPAYRDKGYPDVLHSIVWAKTEKHAIKITNEKENTNDSDERVEVSMKNTKILKYEIPIEDRFTIQMPMDSKVLCVQMQKNKPCIWVICNPYNPLCQRDFVLRGTGIPFDPLSNEERYIGTFQAFEDSFVGHLFELWS